MNKQFETLIKTAQNTFICELSKRIEDMELLLASCGNRCTKNEVEKILRFFHSINGTASTVGLNQLASIGREWEEKIQNYIEKNKAIDVVVQNDIHSEIDRIKRKMIYLVDDKANQNITCSENNYVNISDRGKVLLIDDDVTILKLLEYALSIEGYTVYICDDSESALDVITITRPDVIMLDIMMPKVDGYELLAKIKATSEFSDIHVIFLSAINNIDDKIRGMKAGADDYITKPFIIDEVLTRVEAVLRRSNQYRDKALRDDLTDAYSRYYFNQCIDKEIERYKHNGTEFSITFLDIDRYKLINDKFGHQTGDYILKELVSFLVENIRKSDSLYRYGGEEFIILMPGTSESRAYSLTDKLRAKFALKKIDVGGSIVQTSFSAGITQINDPEVTGEQLINNADKAMYHAKKLGRNKVIVYHKDMKIENLQQTLLIVDDENTILKLLRDRLSNIGYNIITAKDGKSAIALTLEKCPDAIILDIILPDIDGFEVCKQIKENLSTSLTKIIMLSKQKEKEDIAKGLYLGADDYITKPFSMVELEARIMRALKDL